MKTTNVDNIIFLSEKINLRAGGPSGYIANLENGLAQVPSDNVVIICNKKSEEPKKSRLKEFIAKSCTFFIFKKQTRRILRNKILSLLGERPWYVIKKDIDKYYADQLDQYTFKTITCHLCKDVIGIRNYLNKRRKNARIIQMSHSPCLPSAEVRDILKNTSWINWQKVVADWQKLEKDAFFSSDILLAPAPESLGPYMDEAEYFKELESLKPFKYLPTGCVQLKTDKTREALRQQYNIKTDFVISYIGRHIPIRGYDILKDIAAKILAENDNVTFLIGGRLDEFNPPLDHPRWVELGQINPAEVLYCSDLFISAGRQSYFDLILLEVLSAGCPVFASNIHGNKAVSRMTNAVTLFDTKEQCISLIEEFLKLPPEKRVDMSKRAAAAYSEYFTPKKFAENYLKMIKEICDEN